MTLQNTHLNFKLARRQIVALFQPSAGVRRDGRSKGSSFKKSFPETILQTRAYVDPLKKARMWHRPAHSRI